MTCLHDCGHHDCAYERQTGAEITIPPLQSSWLKTEHDFDLYYDTIAELAEEAADNDPL